MIAVDQRSLDVGKSLGAGGFSTVYEVTGADSRLPVALAFKEPQRQLDSDTNRRLLHTARRAVELRDAMSPGEQNELDEVAVWPLAMVYDDSGEDVGVLMRCIPDDFFIGTRTGRRAFEAQLLCADSAQAEANGFGLGREPADDDLVRLALMARLAYAIEVIHRPYSGRRLVYGDLNLRNAVVATSPPRTMLLGCDGVADVEDLSRLQSNSAFFKPPELTNNQQKLQDQGTDIYKLGLCVIRSLAVGRGSTQITGAGSPLIRPGLLDGAGIDLLDRAVDADRSQRPTAEEIKDSLIGRILCLADDRTADPR